MSNLTVIDTEFVEPTGGAMVRRSQALAPVQSIEDAIALRAQIVEFTKRIMTPEKDFGTIPGTQKPTLLKPGAEKLCTHFGLFDSFDVIEQTEDWMGTQHGGEPFFAYTVRCCLSRNGEVISQGVGHCNSWETKYRYRSVYANKATEEEKQRGKAVQKPAKGGGTYTVYLLPNEDIFDQVNTFLKMAKKRALIDATLRAVSASEFYTQDVEDLPHIPQEEPAPVPATAPAKSLKELSDEFKMRAGDYQFSSAKNSDYARLLSLLHGKEVAVTRETVTEALDQIPERWQRCVAKLTADLANEQPAETPAAEETVTA
jgi:hypothetical protein